MKKQTYTQLEALQCIIEDNDRVFECDNWGFRRILQMKKSVNEIQMLYVSDESFCYHRHNLDSVWIETTKKNPYKQWVTPKELMDLGIVLKQGQIIKVTNRINYLKEPIGCEKRFNQMIDGKLWAFEVVGESALTSYSWKFVKLVK